MTTSLVNLFRRAEDYFFRGISLECLDLNDSAIAYKTGVPVADLNFVNILKITNALDQFLTQSKLFFGQAQLPFVVVIPQEFCTPEIKQVLQTMDYLQTDQSLAMSFDLRDLIFNSASSFDDEAVIRANDNQLNDWMIPLVGAFQSTVETCSKYVRLHEVALQNNLQIHHFSLYKHAHPVASITLSIHDAIARIDDVGTLPKFQGKGYATHLIRFALLEAKKLGATDCFIEASIPGLSVYQKLGFKPLFENNIYS
jgi:GNAT superfamily N-acetyltransferase